MSTDHRVIVESATPQLQQPVKRGSWFWNILAVLVVIALLLAVGSRLAIDYGLYTPEWMKAALTPVVTVQALPTVAPAPAPRPAQAAPTAVVAPTPFPVSQPAPVVEAQPAVAPTSVADDAPAQLEGAGTSFTRGTICFDGWYYVDGVRSNTRCVGGGGD